MKCPWMHACFLWVDLSFIQLHSRDIELDTPKGGEEEEEETEKERERDRHKNRQKERRGGKEKRGRNRDEVRGKRRGEGSGGQGKRQDKMRPGSIFQRLLRPLGVY